MVGLCGNEIKMMRGFGPVTPALWGLMNGSVPWGPGHHEAYGAMVDRLAGVLAICEDLPDPENRVTLDPELVDGNGIPAPKIHYQLSENSRKMLEAAGAKRTHVEAPMGIAGWHLMGTCRMGTDPERSVVNEWGRAHDVKNLFIVDGSLFVTAGGVNPTCTIQALALYVADQIKKNLAKLFD